MADPKVSDNRLSSKSEAVKHTVGPWSAVPIKRHGVYSIEYNPDYSQSGLVVANVTAVDVEGEANARLITAAPELLEALEAAVEWVHLFNAYGPGLNGFDCEWLPRARSVISKATGAS